MAAELQSPAFEVVHEKTNQHARRAERDCYLFRMPIDGDDLPTYGVAPNNLGRRPFRE